MDGNGQVERRTWAAPELRVIDVEGERPRIEGYAAVYGQESEDLGGFVEVIEPGFFAPVLEDDVRSLWNHDERMVLGRNRAGTMRLEEDEQGLRYSIDPPETQWARDALVTLRRGDVSQSSFGFEVEEDRWEKRADGSVLRTLVTARRLYEVSPVTFPAYPQTSAEARSLAEVTAAEGSSQVDDPDGAEGPGAQVQLGLMRRRLELEELS